MLCRLPHEQYTGEIEHHTALSISTSMKKYLTAVLVILFSAALVKGQDPGFFLDDCVVQLFHGAEGSTQQGRAKQGNQFHADCVHKRLRTSSRTRKRDGDRALLNSLDSGGGSVYACPVF